MTHWTNGRLKKRSLQYLPIYLYTAVIPRIQSIPQAKYLEEKGFFVEVKTHAKGIFGNPQAMAIISVYQLSSDLYYILYTFYGMVYRIRR